MPASRSIMSYLILTLTSKGLIPSLSACYFRQKSLAQLLRMDGPRTEILQRGNEISYFEPGFESFTLSGEHIVDALPSIVFSNFENYPRRIIILR